MPLELELLTPICCSTSAPPLAREEASHVAPGSRRSPIRPASSCSISSRPQTPPRPASAISRLLLGLSQGTVSHHLKILVEAGLLERERRGTWAWYRLVPGRPARLWPAPSPSRRPGTRARSVVGWRHGSRARRPHLHRHRRDARARPRDRRGAGRRGCPGGDLVPIAGVGGRHRRRSRSGGRRGRRRQRRRRHPGAPGRRRPGQVRTPRRRTHQRRRTTAGPDHRGHRRRVARRLRLGLPGRACGWPPPWPTPSTTAARSRSCCRRRSRRRSRTWASPTDCVPGSPWPPRRSPTSSGLAASASTA